MVCYFSFEPLNHTATRCIQKLGSNQAKTPDTWYKMQGFS